jgi:Protein kinase domain
MTAASTPVNAALPSGSRVGGYTIDSLIAAGEFGFVYLAVDSVLLSKVAIKEYFPQAYCTRVEGGEVRARRSAAAADLASMEAGRRAFVEEARLLARLKHPGLVHVLGAFEAHQTAYRVMPYHDGSTLAEQRASWVETPDDEWLRGLLLNLLEPLEALHAANLVHGHVHPGQVILLEGERPVLLGFGTVPRALHQPMDHAYAPVEQSAIGGQLSRGAWTDIYSLAATAWFAATGRAPVASVDRSVGAAFDIAGPIREVLNSIPGREAQCEVLASAMVRALETLPSARPQTDVEFRAALGVQVVPPARRPPAMAPLPPAPAPASTPASASAPAPTPAPMPAPAPASAPAAAAARATAPSAAPAPGAAPRPASAQPAARTPGEAPPATPKPAPPADRNHAALRFEALPARPAKPSPAQAPAAQRTPAPAAAPAAAVQGRKATPEEEAQNDAAVRAAIFAMVDSIPERDPRKAASAQPGRPAAALPARAQSPAPAPAARHAQGEVGPPEWDMEMRPPARAGGGARRALAWGAAVLLSLVCAVAAWRWSQTGTPAAPATEPAAGIFGGAAKPASTAGRVSTDDALADAEALLSRPPMLQDAASAPLAAASAVPKGAPSASAPATATAATPAPAQARATAPARTTVTEAQPASAANAGPDANRTPHEVCAGRSNFALHYCMQITCGKGQYSAHPQCREFRAAEAVY